MFKEFLNENKIGSGKWPEIFYVIAIGGYDGPEAKNAKYHNDYRIFDGDEFIISKFSITEEDAKKTSGDLKRIVNDELDKISVKFGTAIAVPEKHLAKLISELQKIA